MSFNILDAVKGHLTPELISRISSYLGESESGVSKALSAAVPVILSSLAVKANSGDKGANEVFNSAKEASSSGVLSQLSGFLDKDSGMMAKITGWIKSLLGDNAGGIISAIASFAGIKSSSVSSVFNVATSTSLATIGEHTTQSGLSISGLSGLLNEQKSKLLNAIPAGLGNITGLLGLSGITDRVNTTVSSGYNAAAEDVKSTGGMKWLLPLLLVLAALALWYFLGKGCNKKEDAVTPPSGDTTTTATTTPTTPVVTETKGKLDTLTNEFIYDEGDTITLELPNGGTQLRVGRWSTEARLYDFLNDKNQVLDTVKGNWFDFTNVRFKTGGSVLTPASAQQLKNLVSIIKAYPAARFKIGGYTDNTGDAAKNLALSQKRAEAVAAEVVKLGALPSQITKAEGYGDQHPVSSNDTPEGRAQNRRVSVNVKAK